MQNAVLPSLDALLDLVSDEYEEEQTDRRLPRV